MFVFNLTEFGLEAPSLGIMVMGVTVLHSALCVISESIVLLDKTTGVVSYR